MFVRLRTTLGAAAVALSLVPAVALAQSTALTVSLPQAQTANAGSEFALPLKVSEGMGIGSFALSVIYDPSKVDYVKTEASPDAQGFKYVDGKIDADDGMKELILGGTSSTKIAKSGPAVLATIKFVAKPTASGTLSFQLKNPTDDIRDATLESGTVVIGSSMASAAPSTIAAATSDAPSTVPLNISEPPSSEPASEPPTSEPTSELPTSEPTSETSSAPASDVPSEVEGPAELDETGPAEIAGLLALSLGLASLLHRRGSNGTR